MVDFCHLPGAVYIFENPQTQRVKIGMTINDVLDRLKSLNDMWLERKVTCQICGGRRNVNSWGFIPKHIASGKDCPGGNSLPLEKDVAIAETHLDDLKFWIKCLSGSEKGSATKKAKKLEKRIELYRNHKQPVGEWKFRVAFYTECAEQVELLSHEILVGRLDKQAPLGEVFCCSVSEATGAIETALRQLGLFHAARKETHLRVATPPLGLLQ